MPYRPDHRHPEIKERSIRVMARRLAKWARSENPDEYMDAARHVMTGYGNGYDLAHDLESYHRMIPDTELVEICEDKWGAEIEAETELVKEWVKAEGITVPFNVGDEIVRPQVGVITKIHTDEATCSYRFAEGRGFGVADYEDVFLKGSGNEQPSPNAEASGE